MLGKKKKDVLKLNDMWLVNVCIWNVFLSRLVVGYLLIFMIFVLKFMLIENGKDMIDGGVLFLMIKLFWKLLLFILWKFIIDVMYGLGGCVEVMFLVLILIELVILFLL